MISRVLSAVASVFLTSLLFAFACSSAKDSSKFAPTAAQGGMAEVEMGRLALQRAADPAVKDFGQRMVMDHSRAGAELKTIASKKNIQLPGEVTSEQKSTMDKLANLSGAEFDKQYMSEMLKDHEADAKEFQTQANEGTDADIKGFAAKVLPIIQDHLQMARDVAKKVGAN
jgi:putative membrane protein